MRCREVSVNRRREKRSQCSLLDGIQNVLMVVLWGKDVVDVSGVDSSNDKEIVAIILELICNTYNQCAREVTLEWG